MILAGEKRGADAVLVGPSPYLASAILRLIAERHDFGFVTVQDTGNARRYTIRGGDKGAVGDVRVAGRYTGNRVPKQTCNR